MTREEAEEYAKEMTYRDAVYNALQGKCIPYRKATFIKLYELLDKLEQEPCNAVSREAVLDLCDSKDPDYKVIHFKEDVECLPPVTPQMMDQWQELKETIIEMRDNDGTGTQQEVCKFLANLMDVLEKQMSSSEIPNSSDCISRQAALDCFTATKLKKFDFILYAREEIKKLPPVNPQPKTGYWIEQIDHEENCRTLICSNCDRPALHDGDSIWKHKFCPHCGAKMQEVEDGNND